MGGDMLCLGCNLREENPARRVKPAFMRRHMAAEFSMGSGAFYNEQALPWGVVHFV